MQGLFSMIELAELKRQGIATSSMNLDTAGAYVRSRVASIMNSPLITTPGRTSGSAVRGRIGDERARLAGHGFA